MKQKPKEIGKNYPPRTPTVSIEFDLTDLYDFQSGFALCDKFRDDLQVGIDYLHQQQDIEEERKKRDYGIAIVLVDEGYADWEKRRRLANDGKPLASN